MVIINKYSNYEVKKSTIESIGIIAIFIFSFINTITLLISLILALLLLRQKEVGAIKILNLITLRTVINPGIAVNIASFQNIKMIILLGCSIYLLFSYFKLEKNELRKVNLVIFPLLLFAVYNVFIAFIISSLPIVAIFKLISYVIVFLGVLIGIGYTHRTFNWLKWIVQMFFVLFVCSLILIPLPLGYLRNGQAFQGLTNQPNMFGILAVIFIAVLLTYTRIKINNNWLYTSSLTLLTVYMIILSHARTALISSIIIMLLFILFSNLKKLLNLTIIIFSSVVLILLGLASNINEHLIVFLYKGKNEGNLLGSRIDQIGELKSNILNNPWFGNGFSIPVLPYKSYIFNYDFVVENGNLILAVLSYSGIMGSLFFIGHIFAILWSNKERWKQNILLPIAVILINMGEMVFFSSNNIGVWCYILIALYVFIDADYRK